MNVSVDQWSEPFKKVQESFQALTMLNMQTLQSFYYLKPENLANFKNPEELLDKEINIAFENGHKALDYMQKSFLIMEKAILSFVPETKK